jgi:UDP-2,4-diacetamido-2,4,6-trideoxy-beta-L-altropyranose hydrolase
MPENTLLIRADAGAEIGVGHVMRCLALAQSWQMTGGSTVFAIADGAPELEQRLLSENFAVVRINSQPGSPEDATETMQLHKRVEAQWLILDGFHFSQEYCCMARNGARFLLLIDDDGMRSSYRCDIVLNTNPQASDSMYPVRKQQTRFLLGLKYALLRREFLERQGCCREVSATARRILITFGGADPNNVTLSVLEALQRVDDLPLEITVLVGASNPRRRMLKAAVEKSVHPARFVWNSENMPDLMSHCDLAITAGGATCYELAFMKTPMFLITMAANHERTVEAYGRLEAAIAAGWFHSVAIEPLAASLREVIVEARLRESLRQNASRLVDGLGARRVVDSMLELSSQGVY